MTLNGVMAVTLRFSLNLVNLRCRKRSVAQFMQESIVFLVRVQCRRKESSRSLSHLLMSFLFSLAGGEFAFSKQEFPVALLQKSSCFQLLLPTS